MKKIKFVIFGLIVLLLVGCSAPVKENQNGKLTVVTTIYPVYDITKNLTFGLADVSSLIPAGVEPHEYEPTPSQVADLQNANVFVISGLGFDAVEGKLASSLSKKVNVIVASEGIGLMDATGEEAKEMPKDPHIWLSPQRMIIMTQNIKDGLEQTDPGNKNKYETNAAAYVSELQKLDEEYKNVLSNCNKDTILTTHNAFSYLSKDYGFKQTSISGLNPDAEPSPQKLAELVDAAKKDKIKYVFYEELVDPRIAQTIASEVGAQALELNPIEGSKNPKDNYFKMMRRNLVNLRLALECS
ncbi:zinc ABC transporter substrate-binding protein [Candidatus Micrarchaeota archaeon]|nr:zinc ABC transporter substrate-binding protein [Candidatus Micrarchaeota archaeon]